MLRHHPESIGITLDRFGYADVQELILQMNRHGRRIDFETLKSIVETNDKQRYSFSSDYTKVRANQGHSIPVDLQLVERVPPDVLYHGTATRFLGSILDEGISRQSRQYVHLSKGVDTATKVGRRHGEATVLAVDAARMYRDGVRFYLSDNGVWLTDYVSPRYVRVVQHEG